MITYTFHTNTITKGFEVKKDNNGNDVVFLGEASTKSKLKRVALDNKNPAQVVDNKIIKAFLRKVNAGTHDFRVLSNPSRVEAGQKVVIRINTSSIKQDVIGNGSWEALAGNPELMVKATGIKPNSSRYCDDIVKLEHGDKVLVHPEGEQDAYEISNSHGRIICSKHINNI